MYFNVYFKVIFNFQHGFSIIYYIMIFFKICKQMRGLIRTLKNNNIFFLESRDFLFMLNYMKVFI
jgi:hypothetical protein